MLEITKQPSGDPRENRWQDRPEHWDLWFFSNIKSDSFNIQRLQGWCYHSVEIIVKILRVLILVWPNFIHTYVDRCKHIFYMCYVFSCVQVDAVFVGTNCFLAIICEQQLSLSSSVTVIKMFKTARKGAEICHLESEYTLISLPICTADFLKNGFYPMLDSPPWTTLEPDFQPSF